MSSLFYGRWKQYFQMPIAESVEHLSLSGYRYYGFLCREMNVHSAVDLRYSNAEIAQATGIKDHKTIGGARNELQAARLIKCYTVPPGVYAHVMLDQSGDPIPAPKDRKGIRHYPSDKAAARKNVRGHMSEQPAATLAETKSLPITAQTTTRECRTHGLVPHWKRGEDWLCESCHPNPHPSERWHSPTAKEIGF
jgi:hypothetical protein